MVPYPHHFFWCCVPQHPRSKPYSSFALLQPHFCFPPRYLIITLYIPVRRWVVVLFFPISTLRSIFCISPQNYANALRTTLAPEYKHPAPLPPQILLLTLISARSIPPRCTLTIFASHCVHALLSMLAPCYKRVQLHQTHYRSHQLEQVEQQRC